MTHMIDVLEGQAKLIYACLVIHKMVELGYIENIGFTVNPDKCRGDLLLMQVEGTPIPDHAAGVDTAIGLLKQRAQISEDDEVVIRKLMEVDGEVTLVMPSESA